MEKSVPVFAAALFLAIVHVEARRLKFLNVMPRSRWLSIGGGISVAYVLIHLLPDLGEHQRVLNEAAGEGLAFVEHHAYLLALAGLATFYGLERSAMQSRRRSRHLEGKDVASPTMFWTSIVAFSCYNAFIGYLLLYQAQGGQRPLLIFLIAMALHLIVNDYGLRDHYKELYERYGRWLLGSAVVVGCLVSLFTVVKPAALSLLVAFLAGGVILNVLKEELPDQRESSFASFLLGAAGYTTLLLLI